MKVGVTGHQDLGGDEARAWLQTVLQAELADPTVEHGFTSLAVGSDQLFASILLELHKPYTVIVPCQNYEETFTSSEALNTYRWLRAAAETVTLGPFDSPSEEAFWEAGKLVVEQVDCMIAIWNGRPAQGLGGTADVVAHAIKQEKQVIWLNPEKRVRNVLWPEGSEA